MVVIIVPIHKITEITLSPYFLVWPAGTFAVGHLGLSPAHPFASATQGVADIQWSDLAIHSANFDHLRVSTFPLTAIPTAFFWPTKTTSFLPLVMPV